MPVIRNVVPDAPAPDFSVQGARFAIRGLEIDTAACYAAGETLVEVRADSGGDAVVGGDGPFLAVIEIPARRYEQADGEQTLVPLDPKTVTINLWPGAE